MDSPDCVGRSWQGIPIVATANSRTESERDMRHNSQELCEGARDLLVTRPESSGRSGSLSIQVEVQNFLVLPCHLVRTQVSLRELGSLRSSARPESSGLVVELGPTVPPSPQVRENAVGTYITLSPAFEVPTENMCIVRRTLTSPGTNDRDSVRMNTITA